MSLTWRGAPKVKRIFELFAYQALTLETLIDTLARQGIIYTDSSPRFTKSTLHRILHNRIDTGNNGFGLRLRGSTSNIYGVGSRIDVTVTPDAATQHHLMGGEL